jgi:hypothetical protein
MQRLKLYRAWKRWIPLFVVFALTGCAGYHSESGYDGYYRPYYTGYYGPYDYWGPGFYEYNGGPHEFHHRGDFRHHDHGAHGTPGGLNEKMHGGGQRRN